MYLVGQCLNKLNFSVIQCHCHCHKRHSLIRFIKIKKLKISRCYAFLTKSWQKVINKTSIDILFKSKCLCYTVSVHNGFLHHILTESGLTYLLE